MIKLLFAWLVLLVYIEWYKIPETCPCDDGSLKLIDDSKLYKSRMSY